MYYLLTVDHVVPNMIFDDKVMKQMLKKLM